MENRGQFGVRTKRNLEIDEQENDKTRDAWRSSCLYKKKQRRASEGNHGGTATVLGNQLSAGRKNASRDFLPLRWP